MKNKFNKKQLLDLAYLIIGCLIFGYSVTAILKPSGLATSGFTGLSIILESISGIRYTYFYYAFTIITGIIAFVFYGKKEVAKILCGSLLYSNILVLFDKLNFRFLSTDPVLCTLYYGVFAGLGLGLILKGGYTLGGTDTLSKILQNKIFRFVTLNQVIMVVDGLIIACSFITFGGEVALYSIINHFIIIRVVNYVLYEFGTTLYKVEVISSQYNLISKCILDMGRGVTLYEVTGGYTGERKIILSSVVSPKQSTIIKTKIAEVDPSAFVMVNPILSVYSQTGKRFLKIEEYKA